MPQAVLLDDQQKVINDFKTLGLTPIAEEIENQYLHPNIYSEQDFTKRIQAAADAQAAYEAQKRFYNIIRRSSLPQKVDLSCLHPDENCGPTTSNLLMLSQLNYVFECRTICVCGPTGSGKTLLSCAACVAAARRGMPVKFCRMSDLLVSLEVKDAVGKKRLRDNLAKFKILVLDDYGINAINAKLAPSMPDIVDARYNRGATIVTSQFKFSGAGDPISDAGLHIKDALLDRLFPQNTCVIELSGASRRGSIDELKGDRL